jgi:hypothetical protein
MPFYFLPFQTYSYASPDPSHNVILLTETDIYAVLTLGENDRPVRFTYVKQVLVPAKSYYYKTFVEPTLFL